MTTGGLYFGTDTLEADFASTFGLTMGWFGIGIGSGATFNASTLDALAPQEWLQNACGPTTYTTENDFEKKQTGKSSHHHHEWL